MKTRGETFLVYFGAFGTALTLLRDLGLPAEATLIISVLVIGVLTGLRLAVVLGRRS